VRSAARSVTIFVAIFVAMTMLVACGAQRARVGAVDARTRTTTTPTVSARQPPPTRAESTTTTTTSPCSRAALDCPRSYPAPAPLPCPPHQTTPTWRDTFCGPAPPPGNGLGSNGECTGAETGPPCGPGVVIGRYYAYTLPGTCDGVIVFDGRRWDSELPPDHRVPDMNVWMRLGAPSGAGFISPNGAVGFRPDAGAPPPSCGAGD
jgi:hypothetical protein